MGDYTRSDSTGSVNVRQSCPPSIQNYDYTHKMPELPPETSEADLEMPDSETKTSDSQLKTSESPLKSPTKTSELSPKHAATLESGSSEEVEDQQTADDVTGDNKASGSEECCAAPNPAIKALAHWFGTLNRLDSSQDGDNSSGSEGSDDVMTETEKIIEDDVMTEAEAERMIAEFVQGAEQMDGDSGTQAKEEEAEKQDTIGTGCDGKLIKAVIRSRHNSKMSFVRKHSHPDDHVLTPTCIMRKYVKHEESKAKRTGAIRRQKAKMREPHRQGNTFSLSNLLRSIRAKSSIHERSMSCHINGITTISITNPQHSFLTGGDVNLGFVVITLSDEQGHLRHFVAEVIKGSPAESMELQVEDELLLVTGQLVVDTSPETMAGYFKSVNIDEDFTLLTRRFTGRKSLIDTSDPSQVEYEYWKIRAIVTVDDSGETPVLAEEVVVTQAHVKNGDIKIVPTEITVQQVYIKMDLGYLQRQDDIIQVNDRLRNDDDNFEFEMLSYDALVWKDDNFIKYRAVMIRHAPSLAYIYITDNGVVKLKTAPDVLSAIPQHDDINNDACYHGFCIRNALFLTIRASDVGQKYFLEPYVKTGRVLQYNPKKSMLDLYLIEDRDLLIYKDNATFNVFDYTQAKEFTNKQNKW